MPEIITTCTRCQRQLRVPEELQGRLVKCPACEVTFQIEPAPRPQPAGEVRSLSPVDLDRELPLGSLPGEPAWEVEDRRYAPVRAAAIALLVVGILGLLASSLSLLRAVLDEKMFKATTAEALRMMGLAADEAFIDSIATVSKIMYGGFTILSLIVVIAAIQMLRLRTYWLAITGSVLAMLNIILGCCVVGLPIGIWALVVLLRPGTSSLFRS